MHVSLRVKFAIGTLIAIVAIVYLAYEGAANSWHYYASVDEVVEDEAGLIGRRIRVSGRIVSGSLIIRETRLAAEFDLAGETSKMHVACRCPLPDNLTEEIDVVVEGVLETDCMRGHKVITRCASKYQVAPSSASRISSQSAALPRRASETTPVMPSQ